MEGPVQCIMAMAHLSDTAATLQSQALLQPLVVVDLFQMAVPVAAMAEQA